MLKKFDKTGKLVDSNASAPSSSNKLYQKEYDKSKRMNDGVYHTNAWVKVRSRVRDLANGMDEYEYYITGRIVPGRVGHHIEPIDENPDRIFDETNVIFISDRNHQRIHVEYESGNKEKLQEILFKIVNSRGGV